MFVGHALGGGMVGKTDLPEGEIRGCSYPLV